MKQGIDDFIVESTPVLDLKKQALSSSLGENSPAMQSWDSDRTEVYADIDEDEAIASLILESGEAYPITTFPFVIGRGTECDLVMQGKGISRKHIEIVFQSGRFVVNDLESLNGIKVNGYKVARVILEEGDIIKLGEVNLTFQSGGAGAAESDQAVASDDKNTKSGLFSKSNTPSSADSVDDDTFGPSPAKKALKNVLYIVAIGLFAAAGYTYFNQQRASQPQIAAAPQPNTSATVNANPAPSSSVAPPPPSAIAPPPSLSLNDPANAGRPVTKSVLSTVEPSLKNNPVVVETKPASVAVPKVTNLNDSAESAISKAEKLYFQGNGSSGLSALKPFINNKAVTGSTKKSVLSANSNISALVSQYGQAEQAFAVGNKDQAFDLWTTFMAKEASLYPGRKSYYSKSITSKVIDEYVARGNAASNQAKHQDAYAYWQNALQLGDSVAAQIAIDNVNNKAKQLYRQALRLEYVNNTKAKAMWREVTELLPPGTEYHTKSSAKLAWYEKWGS